MANDHTQTEDAADLSFSRIIDARRDVLFNVWTQAEHLAQWFGPRQAALPFCKIDLRPGGEWSSQGTNAGGAPISVRGRVLKVERPRLMEMTWAAS